MANTKTDDAKTGAETPENERTKLPDGKPNMTPSGEKRAAVTPEKGVKPLKAIAQITYGDNQVAVPDSIFTPVSADERAELLLGDYPAAKEPSKEELALFAKSGVETTDFA